MPNRTSQSFFPSTGYLTGITEQIWMNKLTNTWSVKSTSFKFIILTGQANDHNFYNKLLKDFCN